jgi:hypothetical protein
MAQHLLAAADMWQLTRLRRICERRLCESVDIETAATTLALADQNHAEVREWVGGARHVRQCCAFSRVRTPVGAVRLCHLACSPTPPAHPPHAHRRS